MILGVCAAYCVAGAEEEAAIYLVDSKTVESPLAAVRSIFRWGLQDRRF